MNKENCALKLVDEIILYYDAWSKNVKCIAVVIWMIENWFWMQLQPPTTADVNVTKKSFSQKRNDIFDNVKFATCFG